MLGIGLASLFSEWGHEAASAILPAFLASLRAPAAALGVIEGVSDGLSSFSNLAGGWIADHPQLRKPVLVTLFGLARVHGAFQQSLEKSLAADLLLKEIRGSGFGVLATTNGIGDLVSSVAADALRSAVSPPARSSR